MLLLAFLMIEDTHEKIMVTIFQICFNIYSDFQYRIKWSSDAQCKIAFTDKSLSDSATALLSKPRDSFLDLQLPQSISSTKVQTGDFNLKSSGSWYSDKNTNLVNLNWESLGDKVSGSEYNPI